jgi:hypothetical protein
MKTQKIRTLIFILLSLASVSVALASPRRIQITDNNGNIMCMPVKDEEAADQIPDDFYQRFLDARKPQINRNFDLSKMVKPEAEVEDHEFELLQLQNVTRE